jgi:hypothetical protein
MKGSIYVSLPYIYIYIYIVQWVITFVTLIIRGVKMRCAEGVFDEND